MKVIIAGSTGMIGNLILNDCLRSTKISEVVSLVRKPTRQTHTKLKEVIVDNFENLSLQNEHFTGAKIGFFCIGVYTGQFDNDTFKKITVNYAVEFAKTLERQSAGSTICLLSGAGSDRTEKSKTAFARLKGMAENKIALLNLKFYSFRPAYIYPVESRNEPNLGYKIFRILYPIIKLFGKKYSIKSTELAHAMLHVGLHGADREILENEDILKYVAEN